MRTRKIAKSFDNAVNVVLPPEEEERTVRQLGVYEVLDRIKKELLDRVRNIKENK